MYEDDAIKKRIRERLAALPKFQHWCLICKKYLCTLPTQQRLICFDCWQARRPPRVKTLLEQLIEEMQEPRKNPPSYT